jgi:fatty acid desaturase
VDRTLAYFCFTLVHGVSSTYWYCKHVRAHHVAPNTIGVDTDIELLPFFAMHEDEVAAANRWQRKLFAIQHWIFPFGIALILPNLKAYGLHYLIGELQAGPRRRRSAARIDATYMCGHVAVFLLIPALLWPLWQVVGFYILREIIFGYMLFSIAAPAHFPLEAQIVRTKEDGPSLVAGQIFTTVNFRAAPPLWLITQGAEHQIEHHLLPGANPLRLARVGRFVEPFCAEHGLPYRTMGWCEAVIKSLAAMHQPRPVRRIEELM